MFRGFRRLFAHWASRIIRGEFFETVPMNGVSTGHFVTGVTTAKQVFLTDGTVAHVLARLAIVIVKQEGINAHATVVAMTKVLATADAAKAAIDAVVGSFAGGHPEIANVAMVFTKLNATADTIVAVNKKRVRVCGIQETVL